MYDLYAATGTEKWSFVTGNDVFSTPTVSPDGTTIFIGSVDNKVYALDIVDCVPGKYYSLSAAICVD